MELYDALIKDKRDFCYFYKLQMKSKQEFYRAFCINEPLYPMSIKIFIYIFNLSLNLSFNALLSENHLFSNSAIIAFSCLENTFKNHSLSLFSYAKYLLFF